MKYKWLLISIPLLIASTVAKIPSKDFIALPPFSSSQTLLEGKNWAYTVPFEVHNALAIQTLIQCESQGVNISRPDSDGIVSDGLLQFHEDGTWQDMERLSGFKGSPIIPSDAIFLADWMISHGFLHRWTCAKITGLI